MLQHPTHRTAPARDNPRFTADAFTGARLSEGDTSDIIDTGSSHELASEAAHDHAPASSKAARGNGTVSTASAAEAEPSRPAIEATPDQASSSAAVTAPERSAKRGAALRASLMGDKQQQQQQQRDKQKERRVWSPPRRGPSVRSSNDLPAAQPAIAAQPTARPDMPETQDSSTSAHDHLEAPRGLKRVAQPAAAAAPYRNPFEDDAPPSAPYRNPFEDDEADLQPTASALSSEPSSADTPPFDVRDRDSLEGGVKRMPARSAPPARERRPHAGALPMHPPEPVSFAGSAGLDSPRQPTSSRRGPHLVGTSDVEALYGVPRHPTPTRQPAFPKQADGQGRFPTPTRQPAFPNPLARRGSMPQAPSRVSGISDTSAASPASAAAAVPRQTSQVSIVAVAFGNGKHAMLAAAADVHTPCAMRTANKELPTLVCSGCCVH